MLISKRVLQKHKEILRCREGLDFKLVFCSFLARNSRREATEISRIRSKVSMRSKVRRFYGTLYPRILVQALNIGPHEVEFIALRKKGKYESIRIFKVQKLLFAPCCHRGFRGVATKWSKDRRLWGNDHTSYSFPPCER